MTLNIVTRDAWANTSQGIFLMNPLKHPVPFVLFHYKRNEIFFTNTTQNCKSLMQHCLAIDVHRLKITDIRYNFVVGENGMVYEGRGWDIPPMLPQEVSCDLDRLCYYIGLMGDFKDTGLPELMLQAKNDLINYGLEQNYIDKDFIQYMR